MHVGQLITALEIPEASEQALEVIFCLPRTTLLHACRCTQNNSHCAGVESSDEYYPMSPDPQQQHLHHQEDGEHNYHQRGVHDPPGNVDSSAGADDMAFYGGASSMRVSMGDYDHVDMDGMADM